MSPFYHAKQTSQGRFVNPSTPPQADTAPLCPCFVHFTFSMSVSDHFDRNRPPWASSRFHHVVEGWTVSSLLLLPDNDRARTVGPRADPWSGMNLEIGENVRSTKKHLYRIQDPTIRFWFRVHSPHQSLWRTYAAAQKRKLIHD